MKKDYLPLLSTYAMSTIILFMIIILSFSNMFEKKDCSSEAFNYVMSLKINVKSGKK